MPDPNSKTKPPATYNSPWWRIVSLYLEWPAGGIAIEIDHRGDKKRDHLREHEAADHGEA